MIERGQAKFNWSNENEKILNIVNEWNYLFKIIC